MNEERFEVMIHSMFNNIDIDPLWANAVNLARNVVDYNNSTTDRGLQLLCCAILQKDKEEHAAKTNP